MKKPRMALVILLLASFAAPGWAYGAPPTPRMNDTAAAKEYVCSPCGCAKDGVIFDKPGVCPGCGMPLVEKGSVASRPEAPAPDAERKKVAILIFNGVQIIDYTGPWEVFGQAGFEVFTVAQKPDPITTVFGMTVTPNHTFADELKADILLVPGGYVGGAEQDPQTLKWLQASAEKATVVLSVCNGAYILAKAGLLNGLTATTTAGLIDGLAKAAPNIKVVHDQRFVDNGKIITAGGLSAGIDGALHVVSKLYSKGRAQAVALGLEYNWQPDAGFARGALADRRLPSFFDGLTRTLLSSEGGADHWQSRYSIKDVSSMSEAFEHVNKTLATERKWIRQGAANSNETASLWQFTDENGKQWNGTARIQPATDDKGRFVVSLTIVRSDTKLPSPSSREE
jgi:putative intracellular protease/amidase